MPLLGKIAGGFLGRNDHALAQHRAGLYGGDSYNPQVASLAEVGARTCGAKECTQGWMKPWKSRYRPIFEGEWGCSGQCIGMIVQAAIKRETGGSAEMRVEAPHRHRIPLGLILLAQGWITHPQLQTALDAQKSSGHGRIGDWLIQGCGLDEALITRALGMQWSCPVLTVDGFSPIAMALVMPKRFVAEFGLVPLRVAGSKLLYLAFEDQMNAAAALAIEQMSGLKVESGLLKGTDFVNVRTSLLASDGVPVHMDQLKDADALRERIVKVLEQRKTIASRLVRVRQYYWLRLWLEAGAMSRVGSLPTGKEDVEDHLFIIDGKNS